jgi:hypothetical protein
VPKSLVKIAWHEPITGYVQAVLLLVSNCGTNFVDMSRAQILVKIAWHEPKEILSTSATDLLSPNHAFLASLHHSA